MIIVALLVWCDLGASLHNQRNSLKLTLPFVGRKMKEGLASDASLHFLDLVEGEKPYNIWK